MNKQYIDVEGTMGKEYCLRSIAIQNASRIGLDPQEECRKMAEMGHCQLKEYFKKTYAKIFVFLPLAALEKGSKTRAGQQRALRRAKNG